jgi:Protein of unknown function (DUF3618)
MSDHDSPEEIERDIEQTRANIDRTLSDLQHRLAPNALIDKALASMRVKSALRSAGSGSADMAANLGRVMSSNPIPVLLTAVGIAWLAFSGSSPSRKAKARLTPYGPPEPTGSPVSVDVESESELVHGDEVRAAGREDPSRDPQYQHVDDPTLRMGIMGGPGAKQTSSTTDYGHGALSRGSSSSIGGIQLDTRTDAEVTESLKAEARRRGRRIGERARDAAASVSAQVGHASETLSHGVERMTGVVKGSSGHAYDSTRNVASRATHAVRQVPTRVGGAYQSAGSFVQENPIISGALALALGAALALMLPPTRRERSLIGPASDEVKASVRQGLEETVGRAKDAVRSATEAAADAARKEATKIREAVEDRAESVAEEVSESDRSDIETAGGARPS